MSEGKWVKAEHGDIREGDTVRVTTKDGVRTTIIEGGVTRCEGVLNDRREPYWTVEEYENFFAYEFVPDEEQEEGVVYSTLEKFVPAFVWPTKLGAVVTGVADEGDTVYAVLVEEPASVDEIPLWYTKEWGTVNMYDIDSLEDLTVVSEGVAVGD